MNTPIVAIVFNRVEHARRLRARLEPQRARSLFLVADGPRAARKGEADAVRRCVAAFEDWPSTVHFNVLDENVGCKRRISSGLDWVFEHTTQAIILEDDLNPSDHFFDYCDIMLERYANDDRVASICGTKTFADDVNAPYYFSRYGNSWGWATWANAWARYDEGVARIPPHQLFVSLRAVLGSSRAAAYWCMMMHLVRSGRRDSWAYCWIVANLLRRKLHVYPGENLITNTGFGVDSTHTKSGDKPYMPQKWGRTPIDLNMSVPVEVCSSADQWIDDVMYSKSWGNRTKWFTQRLRSAHGAIL